MEKVNQGQKLSIRAQDWNAMLDAAQAEKDRRNNTGGGSIGSGLEFGMVLGRNATGKGLIPGQPAVADGFIQAPDDSVNPFKVVLRIMAPDADDLRPMVVSVDGCDSGALGRFRVTGPAIVRMARLPEDDEHFVAFGPDGILLPGAIGTAGLLAAGATYSMILLGAGNYGEPPPKGMFQILDITPDGGDATVRICNGNNPDSGTAGIATINSQAYSCPVAEFALTPAPQYFFLKFTPPQVTGGEQTAAVCELVAMADTETVVSTDSVLYSLIGHAWTETVEEHTLVKISQDHLPGLLNATWYGPCIGLLEGVVE